jgi:hypothetical protein
MRYVARRRSTLVGAALAAASLTAAAVSLPSAAAAADRSAHPASSSCGLSAELVPSCGVMLGAYSTSFGGSNVADQFTNFNTESGSTISVGHDYRSPGQSLSGGDVTLAKTPGALLLVNWKPTTNWSLAGGGDSTVNSQIDAMARSVQALGTTKIIMTIFHEPEISVSGGATGCPSTIYKGHDGTPAQYRAMWANVESRFAALGVSNVVWSMDYVGYSGWNCMVDDMWPGNSLVDWVLGDPYMTNKRDFAVSVGGFYDTLTSLSDSTHDYLSKPWGLGEFGDLNTSTAVQNTFYTTVKQALDVNEFPNLKLLTLFDSIGHLGDSRVAYDETGHYDTAELANLATLSQDPVIVAGRQSVDNG